MKLLNQIFGIALTLTLLPAGVSAQDMVADSTGLPGDHFNLQEALEIFKKADSPEQFEKLINTSENKVNNLDLNGDGDVDYIRVIDKSEKDVHAFVLQVAVSESENQDIAVIELEKTGNDNAVIQIVGDEEIFGEQLVVEPGDEEEVDMQQSKEKNGPNAELDIFSKGLIVINVWPWPCVRFVYGPVYRPWVSPWRWRVYPSYWRPWRPVGWRVFHPYRAGFHHGYRIAPVHRVMAAHRVYAPHRASSLTVRTRNVKAHNNFKVSTQRTRVTGPGGRSVTKKTTTVRGRNGNVRAQSTTKVRRGRK